MKEKMSTSEANIKLDEEMAASSAPFSADPGLEAASVNLELEQLFSEKSGGNGSGLSPAYIHNKAGAMKMSGD